jgi:hypothetical protein
MKTNLKEDCCDYCLVFLLVALVEVTITVAMIVG